MPEPPPQPPSLDYHRRRSRIPPSPETRAAFFSTLSLVAAVLSFVFCGPINALAEPLRRMLPPSWTFTIEVMSLSALPGLALVFALIASYICPNPVRASTRRCTTAGTVLALLYFAMLIAILNGFCAIPPQH